MKSTERFGTIIWNYLLDRAEEDSRIEVLLDKPNKSIEECVIYILKVVKQSKVCGFTDEEIYAMAMEYYEDDSITNVGEKDFQVDIVFNQPIVLTEEEKEEARANALREYQNEIKAKLNGSKSKVSLIETKQAEECSLFNEEDYAGKN